MSIPSTVENRQRECVSTPKAEEDRGTHVVLLDMPLDLGRVDPGDKVFHVARDEERRVRDGVGTDADVTLLNVGNSLRQEGLGSVEGQKKRKRQR